MGRRFAGVAVTAGLVILLSAAALALALEASGAAVGERKRVARVHQVVVVVVAAVASLATAPGWPAATVALALVLFALAEGPALLGERAALALLVAAGASALTSSSPSSPALLGFVALWAAALAGLSSRADEDAAAEAATKTAVLGAVASLLCGAGLVARAAAAPHVGLALEVAGLALVLGVPPLQALRVDVAQGAPVSAVVLGAPLALVVLGPPLAVRLTALPDGTAVLDGVVVLALLALPLVALAQTSVRRVLAVLAVSQAALPLAGLRAAGLGDAATAGLGAPWAATATFTAALGAAGLVLGVAALPALSPPAVTWEDAAGQGRRSPWRAGLLVLAAAQACGLPPATGFALRMELARAFAVTEPVVAAALLVGAGLATIPVIRLALFLFAKEPRRAPPPPPAQGAVAGLVLVVALGVVVGLFAAR